MKRTLLICNSDEEQVEAIISALEGLGEDNYYRFNADRIHLDYEVSIYPNDMDFCIHEKATGKEIRASDFTSVWYTEPKVVAKEQGGIDEDIFEYVASEYRAAFEAIIACFEMRGITMVSSPHTIARVGNKQKQQMIAKKVGFQLPKQLVTTQNQAFIQEEWSKFAILKPVDSHKQVDENAPDAALPYTQFVHEGLYEGIKSGSVTLDIHYFQERLLQLCEYRVVCFGEHAYAFKIIGDYEVDWRKDLSIITYSYEERFAPNALCTAYLKETGLNFGSFDLMETKDGYFFIECNSPGFFLFCDESNEIGLAEKFAAYLLE